MPTPDQTRAEIVADEIVAKFVGHAHSLQDVRAALKLAYTTALYDSSLAHIERMVAIRRDLEKPVVEFPLPRSAA